MSSIYNDNDFVIDEGILLRYEGRENKIIIPENVHTIAKRAFEGNKDIFSVYIGANVAEIRNYAFKNCYNLKNVFMKKQVEKICKYAFEGCYDLQIITEDNEKSLNEFFNEDYVEETEEDYNNKGEIAIPFEELTAEEERQESVTTDYKQLFLELAYIREPQEKENVLDRIFDDDIKIPFGVYLYINYESPKAKEYIIENSKQVMHYLVDNDDMESISAILPIIKKNKNNKEI